MSWHAINSICLHDIGFVLLFLTCMIQVRRGVLFRARPFLAAMTFMLKLNFIACGRLDCRCIETKNKMKHVRSLTDLQKVVMFKCSSGSDLASVPVVMSCYR